MNSEMERCVVFGHLKSIVHLNKVRRNNLSHHNNNYGIERGWGLQGTHMSHIFGQVDQISFISKIDITFSNDYFV